jgi:hypothetical protein
MSAVNNPVGSLPEVFQEDEDSGYVLPAIVAVKVVEAVEIHEVPSVSGGCRSFALAINEAKKLTGQDPRRRIVRVWSDQAFYIGTDANEVQSRYGALAPATFLVPITHQDEIWVMPIVAGTVSFIAENWAD